MDFGDPWENLEATTVFERPAHPHSNINTHPLAANPNNLAAAPVAIMTPNMSDKRPLPGAKKGVTDMADKPECILHGIDSIIGHRPDPRVATLFQLHVQWQDGGPTTWEPKYAIQENAEGTVFTYWDNVNDGRLDAMDLPTITVPAKEEPPGGNQKEICKRLRGHTSVKRPTNAIGQRRQSARLKRSN